jgi:DNA-binding NarL/FixJ family response regulator
MPRVLVVESGLLLDEGVESLLGQELDLQVSGITYADDASFLDDVSTLRPDVILLNEAGPLDSLRILELLENIPTLASLRVVTVRRDDNTIDMYERKRVVATHSSDFFDLIRSGNDPRR